MGYTAHFSVWRGDARGGALRDFRVEVNEGEVVLDVIHRLQATVAPDLAVRWNCKAGKCGSCSAEVNGRPRLMCMTRMSTFDQDETITVTPMRAFPVIRDLVTDVSYNYEKALAVPSFAPPPGLAPGEYRMQQVDVERSQEFRKCIECFLCQDTCHVIRDHEDNKENFSGPRFLMRIAELDMHPLDTADRRLIAQEEHGLGFCNITKCCTEVCPEHIKITDNALIPMKERVADVKYDPFFSVASLFPHRGGSAEKALRKGDAVTAEESAAARLRQDPRNAVALGVLADAQVAQDKLSDAVVTTRQRVTHTGGRGNRRLAALSAHARTMLVAAEAGQIDFADVDEEIGQTLKEAQQLASSGTVLAGSHAMYAALQGRTVEAERECRDALAWQRPDEERSDDLLTLASVLAAQGRQQEAESAFATGRELWPDNPRILVVRPKLGALAPGHAAPVDREPIEGEAVAGEPISR